MNTPIIIALDYSDLSQANELIEQLDPKRHRVKIGKALFTRFGPEFVKSVVNHGFDVFLDLKFHDIPNTVADACHAAADLGVWMLNVHASGGRKMCDAARNAIEQSSGCKPLLTAVTILTSLGEDDLQTIGFSGTVSENVKRLALLAQEADFDGVVCSANEAKMLREVVNKDFCLVTPGIRLKDNHPDDLKLDDQARIMTPQKALAFGADYLVIGRPITQAVDPIKVLKDIEHTLM